MPSKMITSLTNAKVKSVTGLRDRKQRAETGLTIVEGIREVTRAVEGGVPFKEIYVCRDFLKQEEFEKIIAAGGRRLSEVPVYETTKAVFAKMSYGERVEGVLSVCAPRALTFKDFSSKPDPIYVLVERVEKPGNVGAILRTCDGAGVDGVIICDGKTDIHNPNVIRASLGTVFTQKIVVSSNEQSLDFLRSKGVKVCAAQPQAKSVYTRAQLTKALAVVVGSEQNGLTDFWDKHADFKVRIPMRGRADSLNVSASTAILLYEIIRQRSG